MKNWQIVSAKNELLSVLKKWNISLYSTEDEIEIVFNETGENLGWVSSFNVPPFTDKYLDLPESDTEC